MKDAEWTLIGNNGAKSEATIPPEKKDPSTSMKPSGHHAKPQDKAELIDGPLSYQIAGGWTVLVPDPSNKTGGR